MSVVPWLWGCSGVAVAQEAATPAADAGKASVPQPPNPDLEGRKQDLVDRIKELRQEVLDRPGSAAPWGRLGWTFMVHGFSAEAVECLTRSAELDPRDMRWPYLAGLTLLRIDRTQARYYLQETVKLDGDYLPARIHLGRLLAEVGQAAESRAQFAVALTRRPDSWYARLAAAEAAQALGDFELALRYLDQAVALAPEEREVRFHRAHLLGLLNDAPQAAGERARAKALPPSLPMSDPVLEKARADAAPAQLLFQRGLAHYQSGRIEEAIAEWKKALEADSDAQIVSIYLGPALVRAGRPAEALEYYKQALLAAPDNPILMTRTADLLRLIGEHFEAVQYYRHALEVRPGATDAMLGLAECLYVLAQFEPAAEQFTEALRIDPHHRRGWLMLADALFRLEKYDQAIRAAADGLHRFPGLAGLDLTIGKCLERQGQHTDAMAAFEKAVQADEHDWTCHLALARAHLTAPEPKPRDYRAALEAATRAAQLAPDSIEAVGTLALALLRVGRFEQAVALGQRVLETQPRAPVALLITALGQIHLDHQDDARPRVAQVRQFVEQGGELDAVAAELLAEAERLLD